MNRFSGLFVLFTYFQFSKLTIGPTVPTNETQTHTLAKFFSGSLIDIEQDAIEGTSIETPRDDRRIILDLKDIDLKLFDVTDEYYNKYLTKYINLKDHTRVVKIVEGDVLLHEPKTGEKYVSSVIRANKFDLYLRYEFRDAQDNVKTIIYYKANDAWYTLPSESTSDPVVPFESDKCPLDSILRESEEAYDLGEEFEEGSSEDSEGPEESDLTTYSHNVDSLYIKFVLDINSKEESERVNFRECYIQDNHSLVYIIRRGYRVSSVREGSDLVCEIPEGTECFFLQVLLQQEEPKFVLAMSKDGSRDVVNYYEKTDGKWEGITSEDYNRSVLSCKSRCDHKTDTELDIRLRRDTNEVLFIDSDYDNVHTHIYAPMPGYAFKKIKIKDHTIWKRKEDDCQMVMVRFLHNYPNKVHLVMPSNASDLYYRLKKKHVSYSVRRSAKSIKFEGEFDAIDEKKYSEEIEPLRFQPPIKFPSNKFVVDIREKRDCEIYMFRQGKLMGVETRFYMAKDGYKIAMVREGESELWKSTSSEFASFVVVLLSQNSAPVLARVVAFDADIQSRHRYFIKANSRWKEIDSLKYRSGLDKLCTFASRLGEEERKLTVDLSKNYETGELISMRYHFDGMDTRVLMPTSKVKIQSVVNKGHLIWEKGEHECVMVICRLNGNRPYFVNIVKAGGTSDEFFYVSTLQAKDESNDWKKVIFDHIYVQIKESRVKPYIQHSYKEHEVDVSAERHDEACVHKTGDFYNIPCSYYIMKTGHGITRVLDRGKEIWRSNNGEYSPYLVMLYDRGRPRLLFVMINKPSYEINETTTAYLERKEEGWEPMYGDVEFNFVLNKMEVKDKRAQKFELDIGQRSDDERVLCFEDKFGVRNIILYFPKKNYRLVKLKDGEDVIMETGTKDYIISVKMYVVGNKPYLIRVRYRHEEMRFKDFERVGSSWVEIDYNAFLIKTLTLSDVFLSEVNVLKSSLFDKEYTKLGSDKEVPEEDLARKIKERLDHGVHFESIDKDALTTPVERIFELISEKVRTEGEDEWLCLNGGAREGEECVLDIRNIDLNQFTFHDNVYKNTLHRVVENKNECKVIKVKEDDEDIHDVKEGQKLFRCHIYNREGRNEIVDIFTHDENHRLNYFIYVKREGLWEKSYWRTSDLLYKLYRYMSRPVKRRIALDLAEVDEQDFQVEERRFASYSHKTVSPNSDVTVSRVTQGSEVVHSVRSDQTLVWCSHNEMGPSDDVLDLFVTDLDGKLYCYSYKRGPEGWSLNYTHKSTVSSLEEFSSRRFKALVSHRLVDTCDGEVLDEAEKEDVELNIDSQEATVEYALNSTHCKMFRPRKSEKVTSVYDGGQELLNANVLKTKALLASFLYLKDDDKSVLYVFLVDEDGNVERVKYYRVSDRWVISHKAPESYKGVAYELDNVSNKDVIEYLDDSFNCKFTKDLEHSIAAYEANPTMKPYLRQPIWILDLNNVDESKFKVTRATEDSREYNHVAPKPFVLVDRIVYNGEIVHDLTPGDMLEGVTVRVGEDEYEISCDIESPDGALTTYTRRSNEPEPTRILYSPTSRSLYRPGNLYEIAGSHVMNIANLTNEHCVLKSTLLRGHMIKRFVVNDDLIITRVFEGVRLINIVRANYKLVSGTVFYDEGPAMIVLKCKSRESGHYRSVYVKLEFEWMLIGEGEAEKYLRSLYPEGKYFTAPEIKDLLE